MKPKVSVVVTTYNRLKRLKKTIKGIQKQTFKDYEIVIVDDHSTDGTENYCKKLIKRYDNIQYIRRNKNYGEHTRPKNEGTKASKADLIAYCDDDVVYRPDHLQVLYQNIKKSGADVVYGDRMLIDETKRFVKTPMMGIKHDFDMMLLGQRNYIDTSDVLCKKEAIEEVGGWDEELPKFADWNLWIRMGKARKKFLRVPVIITDYSVHKDCNSVKKYKVERPFNSFDCKIWPDKTIYGKRKKLKVAIFTLTYGRMESTKKTFKSMRKNTNYPFDHFIIDQGSDKGMKTYITKLKGVKIKHNKDNVGISKGSNQALDMIEKAGDYDIIMKIDNDAEIQTKGWLENIVDIFERTNMVILGLYPEGLKDHPGGAPREAYGYINRKQVGIARHLGGIAIAAPKEAYDNFRWKEKDFKHGIQDYQFSQECIKRGYNLLYLEETKVTHLEATKNEKEKTTRYNG